MKRTLINKHDKIFVAGSRGMAGSAIVRALRRMKYGEIAGGRILTPSRKELDLMNEVEVKSWFEIEKPEVVVLAAATVGGIDANKSRPAEFILENLKIQTNVIETAWQQGAKRLLFLGSSCIYPKHADQPIVEEALLTGLLEKTNASYAIAKIAGIKLCDALRVQHGFDAISLMPTNLYGPGDNYHHKNSHVLPALIRRFHEAKGVARKRLPVGGQVNPCESFYMQMTWETQQCLH